MDPDPERRHASCQEFVDDLLGRLSQAAPPAPAPGLPGRDEPEQDVGKTQPMCRNVVEAPAARRSTSSIPRAAVQARLTRHVPTLPPAAPAARVPTVASEASVPTVPNFIVPRSAPKQLP